MNANSQNDLGVWVMRELFPSIARDLPLIAKRQPFQVGVSFQDLSNLCEPGERYASMTLTLTGPRLPYLLQGVYTCERKPGRAATLRVVLYAELDGQECETELVAAPHARPVTAMPPVASLVIPTQLQPLLPLFHAMAKAPYHLLPAILDGSLHETLWTCCPALLNAPPRKK